MKTIILLLTSFAAMGQIARPTYNPFNNGMMPFYGGFQFPNNTNHPLNFHRPNNFGFQNNFQRPQQNNWQRPQIQPYQPPVPQQPNITPQPQNPQPPTTQPNNPSLFTRKFHLNNGYLFGRPTLWYDPNTNKMQPWVRKNLR